MIIALGYIALLRLKLPYLFINEDIYEIIVKRFTTTSIRVLTADSPIRARRPNHLSRVWRLRRERGGPVRGHPQRGYETRATGVPQSRPDGGLISRTSGQVREQGERPANNGVCGTVAQSSSTFALSTLGAYGDFCLLLARCGSADAA